MNKKLALIISASIIHLALICTSYYFLYTSPSVGITTVWDKSYQGWRVESAEPWSSLKSGDVIKSVGTVDIGPLHLVKSLRNLKDRSEVLSWSEARRRLHEEMNAGDVTFTVIRGAREIALVLSPKMAGLSFLAGMEFLPLLTGFFSFMIVTVVLYKKGLDAQSLILLLLGSFYFLVGIFYFASMSQELVMEPGFDFLVAATNGAVLPIFAVLIVHFSLILPARKDILARMPRLLLPGYAISILIGASLHPKAIIAMVILCLFLGVFALGHTFLTCKEPVERQQMKWIVAGFSFGLTPFLGLSVIPLILTGEEVVSSTLTGYGFCLIFLSIAFAIQKYRLMEIDGLLEGTFVYVVTFALLGLIDLSLMGFLSSRFAHALELRPSGRLFLSLIITLSIYAVIRDNMRLYLRKLLGREPMNERDILLAFTETASGHPPESIVKLFANCIKDVFKPNSLTMVERGNGATEEVLSAYRGLTAPVPLWQSRLQEKICGEDLCYMALPLTRGTEVECVVLLGELPGGRLYTNRELGILQSLLREAKLLYENAWLYHENLKHCRLILEEERRHLSEKEKIIRDLHDGLGGITTNIHLLSEVAGKSSSLSTMKDSLSTISELSREGLAEIRTFMHSLDVENLTWPGLVSDLKGFGAKMIEPNGMAFELGSILAEDPGRPGSLLFLNLFRIYREALTNIVKHSGASRVRVRLEVAPERILLTVEDDGAAVGAARPRKGRGLSHMEKRAGDIGGTISIQSHKGTRVHLEVTRGKASIPQNYPAPGMER